MKISSINVTRVSFGYNFLRRKDSHKTTAAHPKNDKNIAHLEQCIETNKPTTSKLSLEERREWRIVRNSFTQESENIYNSSVKIAQFAHSPEIQMWHILLASLMNLKKYIENVNKGIINPETNIRYRTGDIIPNMIYPGCDLWRDEQLRNDITEILDAQIKTMKEKYIKEDQKKYPQNKLNTPPISAETIKELYESYSEVNKDGKNNYFYDHMFLLSSIISRDKRAYEASKSLINAMGMAGMTKKIQPNQKHHIEFYDKKADSIWQNIAHGNNVLVLSDLENKESNTYLQNSFVNLIHKPNQKYGNLSPDNTDIIVLNEHATLEYVDALAREIQLDKSKIGTTTVIVGDLYTVTKNAQNGIQKNVLDTLKNQETKPNQATVKFVFTIPPETFHKNTSDPNSSIAKMLQSYAQQSLPILNATEVKKYLSNENGIEFIKSKTGKEVSKEAITRAIEITSTRNGNYPEKAISLLETTSKYFIKKDKITASDVDKYVQETDKLTEAVNTNEQSIIFDTGKKLDDIKGMPAALEEAQSIVRQIKDGTIGTKGFIIQHNYGGSYGGGRRHVAEAIAGEAQIPMVLINAKDFALKDIDALSQEAGLSEIKIKKIVSLAKAQAEANSSNTAMIYIENFDNFASDPLYGISSIYEQKAFTQLLSEMENIRKEGKVNIVVIGSMNMPETLDENVMKPYKFLNQIIIYQPQDAKQRKEVIEDYIKKHNLQIAGDNIEEKEKILTNIAESTDGFSIVSLIYLLDNANIISQERGKKSIDSSDLTESYLQTISGRTNTEIIADSTKKITSSHEAGHATTLQIMYEIAKKQNIPWHLPDKIDFITLDPRGNYGGAVYPKKSENDNCSYEKVMSDIVCDYGGHSAENIIYNMKGSWGITADMKMAYDRASSAVMEMGMGSRTGVRYIDKEGFISEAQKEKIEKDINDIISTAKEISDSIVSAYKDFILEFTEKQYRKVGTGECIISGEDFIKHLHQWKEQQPVEKQKELEKLEQDIVLKLRQCQEGKR